MAEGKLRKIFKRATKLRLKWM